MKRKCAAFACLAVALRPPPVEAGLRRAAPGQLSPVSAKLSGSVELREYIGVQYHGDLTLGDQTIPVIYDTGSFDALVISTTCAHCKAKVPIYDPSKSSSFQAGSSAEWHLVFGSGPVDCQESLERIALGGATSSLALENAPFWEVIDHDLKPWKVDGGASFAGVLGLPFTRDSPDYPTNAGSAETLLERLQVPEFAVCLGPQPGSSGWFTVQPGLASLHARPEFQTVPVVGQIHWGVLLSQIKLGAATADVICNPTCGAIVDSGTSMIGAPYHAIGLLNTELKKIKSDCSNINELPDLRFKLGDKEFALPPEGYVLKVSGGVSCMPAFQLVERDSAHGPVWILGLPFLRHHYVVFDRTRKSLHIAADAPCGPDIPAPQLVNATHFLAQRHGPGMIVSADPRQARLPSWANASGDSSFRF